MAKKKVWSERNKTMWIYFIAALVFGPMLVLAGCQAGRFVDNPAVPTATVNGTVTYRERIALPSNAVANAALGDVTAGANTVLGTQQITT